MSLDPIEDLRQNADAKNIETFPEGDPIDFMFATKQSWEEIDENTVHMYAVFEDLVSDSLQGYVSYAVSLEKRND